MKILVFGEILWDIIEDKKHLGGAPLNFAAHTAQLGNYPAIISSVGRDQLGTQALQELSKLSIDTKFVQVSKSAPTGTVQVTLDKGQPQYEIIEDVAYDHIGYNGIDTSLLSDYEVFYFGTLAQRNRESSKTLLLILSKTSFKHIFCDLNLRKGCYTAETIISSIKRCTILKLNDEEIKVVSKLLSASTKSTLLGFWELIKELFPKVEVMIVTLGKIGCSILTREIEMKIPAEPCHVKDTIGAGDAFSAAFLSSFLNGHDLNKSGMNANKVGSFVASQTGAIPELPEEIKSESKVH